FEGRHRKKKIALLIPLLFFFKLKVISVIILVSVLFIKKMILIAGVLLPSLLSMVKVCKPHHPHHHSYYAPTGYEAGEEVHEDYAESYGHHHHPYHYKEYARRSGAPGGNRWNSPYRAHAPKSSARSDGI
ncbi:unnamed protein product, partial [Timema podura]|nr:unnamed protein product [Timema podura]